MRFLQTFLPVILILVSFPPVAGAQEEGKPAGGEVEIVWDGIPLKGEVQIIKRMGRLKKSSQWGAERLPKLCQLALETGRPRLKVYATWYQALIAGHEGKTDLAVEKLKEAVRLGYLNVIEIQEIPELADARERSEVAALIASIGKDLAVRMKTDFETGVEAGLAAGKAADSDRWRAELKTTAGESFWREGEAMIVAVARIHHPGFEQQVPFLRKMAEKVPVGVIFWQQDEGDEARIRQSVDYMKRLGLSSWPCAVIGRDAYLELRSAVEKHFSTAAKARPVTDEEADEEVFREALPYTVFVDSRGVLAHSLLGVLLDWQSDYALRRFVETFPAPAPPPLEETRPDEEKPETSPVLDTPRPEEKGDQDPGREAAPVDVKPDPDAKPEEPEPDPDSKPEAKEDPGEEPPPEDKPEEEKPEAPPGDHPEESSPPEKKNESGSRSF
ncbi:MAG TPA: hypothetical protein VMT52_13765 [Planctomycetota bacterium]|nr:hypothetical protein [Planctomycetota bacterium]